jgi:23S rRNA (guanosine2251-2'-O)-methyltransferase
MSHPRDRYLTVFGRKPVLEALGADDLKLGRLFLAKSAHGGVVDDILTSADRRGLEVVRCSPKEVSRMSRNGRQDQGVALDVVAERMMSLDDWLLTCPDTARLLLLDGVTTPANVGMILRTAVAADWDGIILPRRGSPKVDPMVIKASAGTAFRAPILRAPDASYAADALRKAGVRLIGLRMESAIDLYSYELPKRSAWVLGNEASGVSESVSQRISDWVRIPMPGSAESLNVAVAASVVAFEIVRRDQD